MENPGVVNRSRWSPMRRAQVYAVMIGMVATIAAWAITALQLKLPQESATSQCVFLCGMLIVCPAATLGDIVGIPYSAPAALWCFVEVVVNGLLCFLFGTFIGWAISGTPDGRR